MCTVHHNALFRSFSKSRGQSSQVDEPSLTGPARLRDTRCEERGPKGTLGMEMLTRRPGEQGHAQSSVPGGGSGLCESLETGGERSQVLWAQQGRAEGRGPRPVPVHRAEGWQAEQRTLISIPRR